MKLYMVWYSWDYEGGVVEAICTTKPEADTILKQILNRGDSRGIEEIESNKVVHFEI
jgi:hypothetical protein